MSFLRVRRLLEQAAGLPGRSVRLLASGTLDTLVPYLRAEGVLAGVDLAVDVLPFGTLDQHLRSPRDDVEEAAFLVPWDLCPALDWRTGVPRGVSALDDLLAQAASRYELVAARVGARLAYLDAPVPPLLRSVDEQRRLEAGLLELPAASGAVVVPPSSFSLSTYLATGAYLAGTVLDDVAATIVDVLLPPLDGPGKVLVTDLDNTLWLGVVGEDGPDGVRAESAGMSYRHFVYQTFLARLHDDGIVLAAVSRNDPDLAVAPLAAGNMPLAPDDFVAVEASYGPKSAALARIAATLNVDVASLVFVDDNPVEIAEVEAAGGAVTTLLFPSSDAGLPDLFAAIARLFHRQELTDDDLHRTERYHARRRSALACDEAPSLEEFLRSLHMRLTVVDRTRQDRVRALQLINKTNQFNLNGRRWTDAEIEQVVADGGRLLVAELRDDHGAHGEVIAFLVDGAGVVRAFVMSCRVFQRRVEYAFVAAIADELAEKITFDHTATDRNAPFREFLAAGALDGEGACDLHAFAAAHADDLALFEVVRS